MIPFLILSNIISRRIEHGQNDFSSIWFPLLELILHEEASLMFINCKIAFPNSNSHFFLFSLLSWYQLLELILHEETSLMFTNCKIHFPNSNSHSFYLVCCLGKTHKFFYYLTHYIKPSQLVYSD